MSEYRSLRLSSLMEEELSKLIAKELDIPYGTIASISKVDVSSDNQNAEVGVSVFPDTNAQKTIALLQKEAGKLHHKLIRVLNIRTVPVLNFYHDHGIENAAKVEKALLDK